MNATPMQGRAGYEWATKQIDSTFLEKCLKAYFHGNTWLALLCSNLPPDQSIFHWSD